MQIPRVIAQGCFMHCWRTHFTDCILIASICLLIGCDRYGKERSHSTDTAEIVLYNLNGMMRYASAMLLALMHPARATIALTDFQ